MITDLYYNTSVSKNSKFQILLFSIFIAFGWNSPAQDMESQIRERIQSQLPNIPGVIGFGQETDGGHGGKIIKVTNLNRSGKGSLAEAIGDHSPRIVVFEVAGVINLDRQSFLP